MVSGDMVEVLADEPIRVGDVVQVSVCPTHAPTLEDTANGYRQHRVAAVKPSAFCWCRGKVKRVFWDGTILVSGKNGYLMAFQEQQVAPAQ